MKQLNSDCTPRYFADGIGEFERVEAVVVDDVGSLVGEVCSANSSKGDDANMDSAVGQTCSVAFRKREQYAEEIFSLLGKPFLDPTGTPALVETAAAATAEGSKAGSPQRNSYIKFPAWYPTVTEEKHKLVLELVQVCVKVSTCALFYSVGRMGVQVPEACV